MTNLSRDTQLEAQRVQMELLRQASDEASYITGETLVVDGGRSANGDHI